MRRSLTDNLNQMETKDGEIKTETHELVLLGNKGINVNDPTNKYQIQAWSGEYSGLHLISIMYAAFRQFATDTDIGIDLSKEYRIAVGE